MLALIMKEYACPIACEDLILERCTLCRKTGVEGPSYSIALRARPELNTLESSAVPGPGADPVFYLCV